MSVGRRMGAWVIGYGSVSYFQFSIDRIPQLTASDASYMR